MDIPSIVVSAMVSGLTASLKDATASVVKSLYIKLRTSILGLSKKKKLENAVSKLENTPSSELLQSNLIKELEKLHIESNKNLIDTAKLLLSEVDKINGNRFSINISKSNGIVIGDHNQVEQNFGSTSKNKFSIL